MEVVVTTDARSAERYVWEQREPGVLGFVGFPAEAEHASAAPADVHVWRDEADAERRQTGC